MYVAYVYVQLNDIAAVKENIPSVVCRGVLNRRYDPSCYFMGKVMSRRAVVDEILDEAILKVRLTPGAGTYTDFRINTRNIYVNKG